MCCSQDNLFVLQHNHSVVKVNKRYIINLNLFYLVRKGEIVESTIVYVRYTDKIYRKGFVKSKTYSKLVVGVYCGEVKIVHANDSAAVVPDIVPDASVLQIGSSVIATVDGFFWEAGHIAEIRNLEEGENLVYRVRFIGGGDAWIFNVNSIRILMERDPKGLCLLFLGL